MMSLRSIWYTWRRFEYWPWWFFYVPLLPVYLYYALRSRSFTWFTAANPGIEDGGFFGEEKRKILAHIPNEYKPATYIFLTEDRDDWQRRVANLPESVFPCVMKPDVGERGDDVLRFQDKEALLMKIDSVDYNWILQEFVDYPLELGVYFVRDPETRKGKVVSLTRKGFLKVRGDGVRSVEQLMKCSDRAFLQIERIRKADPRKLTHVPEPGVEFLVEPLGNHCLGTEFIDANEHLCPEIDAIFDKIVAGFEGFHVGRFDLKVPDFESLKSGRNIRIFELNGVSSEPAHMYDSRYRVWDAYGEVLKFWKQIHRVATFNHRSGAKYTKTSALLRHFLNHHFRKTPA
ncbi:MAG: hypothetical protein H6606_07500 [Flavobacteriales bacterium]|nr:hypothetical protein [Flavobacteriales bacterium]